MPKTHTATSSQTWFDIDRKGLGNLVSRKGKGFILAELVQNAFDEKSTKVDITLVPVEGARATYTLTVEDDNPEGFADITHAYTLFAPSTKLGNADQRGRFNLGEKLVLALCEEASISTTKGTVLFSSGGRTFEGDRRRQAGSVFSGRLKLRKEEYQEIVDLLNLLIVPLDVVTTFNGERIPHRDAIRQFSTTLPTEVADDEGILKATRRKTTVSLYDPKEGEQAHIFEMGIPVVEVDLPWHVDVTQRVPLTFDRDNVRPAYLQELRTAVLNSSFDLISADQAAEGWVKAAVGDKDVEADAVKKVMDLRFGENRVAFDPSDPEANKIAAARGYHVIGGRTLDRNEWANVKRFEFVKPAGQVTPSPKVLMNFNLGGQDDSSIPFEKWTPGMKALASFAEEASNLFFGFTVNVEFVSVVTMGELAWYGSRRVTFNKGRLGKAFFESGIGHEQIALVLHELAHEKIADHLSSQFADQIADLGGKLAVHYRTIAELHRSSEPAAAKDGGSAR